MESNKERDKRKDMSFRNMKIFPTVEDLNRKIEPKLNANLLKKAYNNSEHYFETQFCLLREELVRPLVQSVNKMREWTQKDVNLEQNNHKNKTLKELIESETDFNIYTDIQVLDIKPNYFCGIVLTITLDHHLLEDIDWSESQRLMEGSLLCLSSDMFQKSIIFGVITKRSIKDPKTGEKIWEFDLQLDIDEESNKCEDLMFLMMNPMIKYIAIECSTYYEGIRHSLSKLQQMDQNFPLKKYIIDMNLDVSPPPYLNDETRYDLTCIAKNETQTEQMVNSDNCNTLNPLSSAQILKDDYNNISLLKSLSTFDDKQFDAFFTSLTKEFALIQGPPGTGKTFVGLKIVKCLLDNKNVWKPNDKCSPIMIVCYKNHALDQFLGGILKFTKNIIRIGGKSESEDIKPFALSKLREEIIERIKAQKRIPECDRINPEIIKTLKKKWVLSRRIKLIAQQVEECLQKIKLSFISIIKLNEIEPYIKPKLFKQLFNDENLENNQLLINWLNIDKIDNFEYLMSIELKKKLSADDINDSIDVKDINILDRKKRWSLYLYWREKYLNDLKKSISENCETIKHEIKKLKPKNVKLDQLLCEDSLIIGLTITGAAKHRKLVEALNPKIMIVEEAAEVLEGHVVAAMASKIEHLILIGDHQQLRPITNVRELTEKYNLDISLFERMVETDVDKKELKHFKQLTLQHRMRPCISILLKKAEIYSDLRNDSKVAEYPEIKFTFEKNMYFLNHSNFEDNNHTREVVDKSRSNLFEAKIVIELVKYFILRGYPFEWMTVLTTYNAQLNLIRNLMLGQKDIFVKEKTENGVIIEKKDSEEKPELKVRISSVDGFQGEENNIIIISFVRSSKKGSIGFLGISNRVCVALSRARHGLFCVGNFKNMAKESKMWKNIVNHLKEEQFFGDELIVGCKCTGEQFISMPNQFELFNHQIKNRGKCQCSYGLIKQ